VDNITPAASIFLTSIIEWIGETALVIAGETARSRLLAELKDGEEFMGPNDEQRRIDQFVVEDLDMEKLALNPRLGRLWRTWRNKRRRGTTISRNRGYSAVNSRKSSIATIEEPVTPKEPLPAELPPPIDPATIPLPISDYDVQEIEVPGYVGDLEGEVQTMEAVVAHKVRPRSLMVFSSPSLMPKSPGSANNSPVSASAIEPGKSIRHLRSRSLPNGGPLPTQEDPESRLDQPSPTPSEKKQLETMYEDDESAEYVDAAEDAVEITPGIAVTTAHEDSQSPEAAAETSDNARTPIVHEEQEAPPAVNETVASLRAIAVEDEELTDQSNSARHSVASLGDRPNSKDPEVIEGTGTAEKGSTIHRPKRQSSRDANLHHAMSISPPTSDSPLHAVAQRQGIETTPIISEAPVEAVTSIDQDATDQDQEKTTMISTPPLGSPEAKGVSVLSKPQDSLNPNTSRPASSSGDSQRSNTRLRPAPLVVTASNNSSSAIERAAVQRMPIRPSTSVSSSVHTKSRRSGSFGSAREIKRPVTAGSTTSQASNKLKGLMGRPQGDAHSVRMRSSSDTSRASGASGDSVENEIADLDKLINSDETIHFTLTPRSVREMTFPDSPSRPIPRSDNSSASDTPELPKNISPPIEEKHRPHASVSSKATGLTAGTASSGEMSTASRTRSIESKHVPHSVRMSMTSMTPTSSNTTSRSTKSAQARDERAPADSMRDFAEFMRLTGPPPAPNSAPTSAPTNAPTSTPSEPKTSVSTEKSRPIRPPSSQSAVSRANRARLQARPAETNGSQTSDLIDFIREGPPMPAGAHRIPRTVAPFRNTIDSEDLQIDNTSSATSTGNGTTPNKSLSSLSSGTGLLDSANRNKAAASGSAMAFDEPQPPARKQRRVPDPYAIDDDDDDELLEELLELEEKPKPKREEESLMDFLRNAPPPPPTEQAPQPFLSKAPSNGLSGAAGMKARLLRASQNSLRSQNIPASPQTNYSAKVGQERNNGTIPSSSNRKTETSDLADFLRNSAPPGPPRPVPKAKDSGISRFFTRRKKTEA
jgi:hypothetical protein